MEYDSTKNLVYNSLTRGKLIRNKQRNLGNVMKHEKDKKLLETSPPLCQTYMPTVIWKYKPKSRPTYWRKVIPRPQTPQDVARA